MLMLIVQHSYKNFTNSGSQAFRYGRQNKAEKENIRGKCIILLLIEKTATPPKKAQRGAGGKREQIDAVFIRACAQLRNTSKRDCRTTLQANIATPALWVGW